MTTQGTRCSNCGTDNLADARFCATCGQPVSIEHLAHPGLAALVGDDDAEAGPDAGDQTVLAPGADRTTTVGGSVPPTESAVPPMPTSVPPPAAPPTRLRERAWLGPVVAVIAALAAAVIVFAALSLGDDDASSDQPPGDAPPTDATMVATSPATTVDAATTTIGSTAVATTTTPPTTAPAATVPADTAPPVGTDPTAELTAIAAGDLARAQELRERWVPQLSAKEDGTVWEGVAYTPESILALHRELDVRVGGALLIEGSTLAFLLDGERMAGWWFTVADVEFADADAALQWCADAGFDRSNCAARLLTDRDDATGTLRLRPG